MQQAEQVEMQQLVEVETQRQEILNLMVMVLKDILLKVVLLLAAKQQAGKAAMEKADQVAMQEAATQHRHIPSTSIVSAEIPEIPCNFYFDLSIVIIGLQADEINV
jgi:hypothetical protein